ncbi:MAG: class I SAM-dependent methyltransferase [Gammaproteobacteria bacterium]
MFLKIRNLTKWLKDKCLRKISFSDLQQEKYIYLYAGDVPQNGLYNKFVGLSLSQENFQHIKHDVTHKLPLDDSCVDIYQSEDVFEHIEPELLIPVIDEIYRVLKPDGVFRLSLPDYQCDFLYNRTRKNVAGELLFDPVGGGDFIDGKVINGGHVWFPQYQNVKALLEKTKFRDIRFYHYYDESGNGVTNPIDYSIGHVKRTPDHDERVKNPYRPMSIVVDCIK